ncbi:nucleoside-diphosphate-sugar epimerase [Paucimonas lemoignei]|uniref:Nucleoside-diphosphate-sugar epimerase n=1 Tax=Paucimonas lemoignei TaxID=29443 RepID=A0A4R3HZJ6_PAULE|nr:SDR family oxidoreductase [Paucimonas lemoignei]TCS38678.1 nucleoside-diphosphate-sugar epimerase [Paucimonas lemoignei]
MKILVCGASGFIGQHLCVSLVKAGHEVVHGVRKPERPSDVAMDYGRDLDPETWLPRLAGVDAVINAVGILQEIGQRRFDAIHRDAPIALFKACEMAGVRRVIQISALGGANEMGSTLYMRSKREADAYLRQTSLDWSILRPSLIVGADGASSRLFRVFASLPVIGLPGKGLQLLQPVHIDDICAAVLNLLESSEPTRQVIAAVGPEAMTYRGMLQAYRDAMQLAPPIWLPVPMFFMNMAAWLAALFPASVLSPVSLRMLEEGNVADSAKFSRLLGHKPRGADAWFSGLSPDMLRTQAIAAWSLPLFRLALALVWIITGVLSLGIFPVDQSLDLLRRVGLHNVVADIALYGAALLDLAFGLATLLASGRLLWRLQMALIAGYTIIISIFLPEYWLHPFGPILKNIAILALLIVLDAFETRKG